MITTSTINTNLKVQRVIKNIIGSTLEDEHFVMFTSLLSFSKQNIIEIVKSAFTPFSSTQ